MRIYTYTTQVASWDVCTYSCRGSYWTGLRGSLQPLFHSTGLQSYQPLIEAAVAELCDDLAPAARDGSSVDMHAALSNVALKAIGEAAFG